MERQLSILNVGGHPKDAIMYAGGTAAMHVARGDRVCNLTPTHGLSHHETALEDFYAGGEMPDLGPLIEERKKEFVDASNDLGVTNVRFLGYDDDIPVPKEEIIYDIADVIGDIRPDIIITHNPYDETPAHANATRMVILAMEAAMGFRPNRRVRPHEVHRVFYHTQPGRSVNETVFARVPTTLIDITDVVHKKSQAMNRFRSQWYGGEHPTQRKLGEALDGGMHAIIARVPYAEHFIAQDPQVYKHLPLSEYGLELTDKPVTEQYEYMTQMLLDP